MTAGIKHDNIKNICVLKAEAKQLRQPALQSPETSFCTVRVMKNIKKRMVKYPFDDIQELKKL